MHEKRINMKSSQPVFFLKLRQLGVEKLVAIVATVYVAVLLVLMAMYAGPLWRDEVNTANIAGMPSLQEMWNNMPFESFPPLWPLLLRGCSMLGLAGSDAAIRVLGLYVGLFFLTSLWLASRWMGNRPPILSIALLGCLPSFIFIVGSNRAYGLASCLLVLSFGVIWRVVELPSRSRILWAGLICILFTQSVYYDVIFLFAMLAGGAVVALRRRCGKTFVALAGIGVISSGSLVIYLPIIRHGAAYTEMNQLSSPDFPSTFQFLWDKLANTLTFRSSAEAGLNGLEIWLWVALVLVGSILAIRKQFLRRLPAQNILPRGAIAADKQADLALYCFVSMVLGTLVYLAFLLKLRYPTQTWYYVEMLCLCAISIEGLLGASLPVLRPWGLLRIGFMVLMMAWGARSAWAEAHTRRSNMDLVATILSNDTVAGDLIVVQSSWEGITFNRYYHGQARWVTVPPIDSHLVHRNDQALESMKQEMEQQAPMSSVLHSITNTLQAGNAVWLVGNMVVEHPRPSPASGLPFKLFRTYVNYWSGEVAVLLVNHARHEQVVDTPVDKPVCALENLPLIRFTGYKSGSSSENK